MVFPSSNKTQNAKPALKIGDKLKPVIPSNSCPFNSIEEPNEQLQIDFCGPNYIIKDQVVNFLACINFFLKFVSRRL